MADAVEPGVDPRLIVGAYKTGSRLARMFPGPLAAAGARAVGLGLSGVMADRRHMIERHLRRVRGPELRGSALRAAAQRSFEWYARYWVDSFRIPDLSAAEIDRSFSYEGVEHLDDALAAGRGVILAIPHLGSWEWAGRWVADRGIPITVVVEPLEPPELFEWFAGFRESLGMTVVPLGPGASDACLKALRDNAVLCLLCDRDIGRSGVEVEFFGERTTLPAGPATLALRTGAPLLPTAVYFRQPGCYGVVRPPLPAERSGRFRDDVAALTQVVARELEYLIRIAPEQWHLMQPNWPSDPGYDD